MPQAACRRFPIGPDRVRSGGFVVTVAGHRIPLEALLHDRDRLAAAIVRAGGLLAYGKAHLRGAPTIVSANGEARPRTYAEKIIARHRVVTPDCRRGSDSSGSALLGPL